VFALVVASGCAKGSSAMRAEAPPADMPGYGGGAYDADGTVATGSTAPMEPAPAPMGEPEDAAKTEMATPAVTGERARSGGQSGADPAIDDRQIDAAARHIIYTAQMVVSVFDLEAAMVKAEAIPDTWGGYIQTMSTGLVVLRVPSKSLRKVMEEVGEYGVVEQRSLQAQDVTAEFVDIDSRLRALEETHKQLLELLSKARTVKEALEVREALDRITGELEVLKGRMRQLQNLISFSTLSLTLQERGPHVPTPSSNDPFPWVNELGVEATEWR
jgi:hypothetical protein